MIFGKEEHKFGQTLLNIKTSVQLITTRHSLNFQRNLS